jgi:adenylate cyclase
MDRRLTWAGVLANSVGTLIVFLFVGFILPGVVDADEAGRLIVRSAIVGVVYLAVTLALGRRWMRARHFAPIERWLSAERPATHEEQLEVLRYPQSFAKTSVFFWVGAALLFSSLNSDAGITVAATVGVTLLLGGETSAALQYLIVERILRPVTARALAGGAPPHVAVPGVATRLQMAWSVATGVPLLGVVALAVAEFAGADFETKEVVGAMLFLAALALTVGLLGITVAARSVADPVGTVRSALEEIEQGDFETRVPVDDGSEVGMLQAGFNRMATGLQEREQLREAFGTFVDPELTQRVLDEGTDLAGEEVDLSVMFLDVRGFTTFAERAGAQEVVARLNDLYGLIVPIILEHGGHASKFIGDGLLAVFGAPERLADHADRAVAAALEIARAVRERYGDELRVGVGVNSGPVVAGTVGGGGRLDFTVIGDPVNTAARVEAATRQTDDDVLVTDATRSLLSRDFGGWEERPPVPLKGKSEAVALFAPRAAVPEARPG